MLQADPVVQQQFDDTLHHDPFLERMQTFRGFDPWERLCPQDTRDLDRRHAMRVVLRGKDKRARVALNMSNLQHKHTLTRAERV